MALMSVAEALRQVLEHAAPLASETVPLVDAYGRVLVKFIGTHSEYDRIDPAAIPRPILAACSARANARPTS